MGSKSKSQWRWWLCRNDCWIYLGFWKHMERLALCGLARPTFCLSETKNCFWIKNEKHKGAPDQVDSTLNKKINIWFEPFIVALSPFGWKKMNWQHKVLLLMTALYKLESAYFIEFQCCPYGFKIVFKERFIWRRILTWWQGFIYKHGCNSLLLSTIIKVSSIMSGYG